MKYCKTCSKFLTKEHFSVRTDRPNHSPEDPSKYSSSCFECTSMNSRLRFFGITLEEFNTLREVHEDKCAICGLHEFECRNLKTKYYGLYVDHCHSTEKVRGLLCHSCNLILGHAKDDKGLLEKAIQYLDTMI
ncbi:Recombination endonuclease VII [compost metagenome]